MRNKIIFIFDVDNTLVESHNIYDEAYRLASKEVFDKEFIMTKNPDGSKNKTFSKMSNSEILNERLAQLGINTKHENIKIFWKKLGDNTEKLAIKMSFIIYPYVENFVRKLAEKYKLFVVTTGPKQLQTTILSRARLINFFDIENSLFLSNFNNKKEAIEKIFLRNPKVEKIVYIADSPKEMKMVKEANIPCERIAIGVTICGLVTKQELINAGADFVLGRYNNKNLALIKNIIER